MATSQQLEMIAARMFPDIAPGVVLAQTNLFLARVMSAGDWNEVKTVQEHFDESTLRGVLYAPPDKIFDRQSWSMWHAAFGLGSREMPESFFTVYPWFRNRTMRNEQEVTAELIGHLPDYTRPVRSCDEMQTT